MCTTGLPSSTSQLNRNPFSDLLSPNFAHKKCCGSWWWPCGMVFDYLDAGADDEISLRRNKVGPCPEPTSQPIHVIHRIVYRCSPRQPPHSAIILATSSTA